jgi:glycosyltransferase involved in cell wall biosynthesis
MSIVKLDCFVSVIAPIRDDSEIIEEFIRETVPILRDNFKNYELLLIDDDSRDDSVQKVGGLLSRYEGIRLVQLSRHFGLEMAISAGLESVIGDYVVVVLPYMDPPQVIPALVERSLAGNDVVFGVRTDIGHESWSFRVGSRLFHWYCERFLQFELPRDSTQLRCLSRMALNAITQIKDSYRYMRLASVYVGYPHQTFSYTPIDRGAHRHKRNMFKTIGTAIDLIIENSRHPLRFVTWTGLLAAVLNMIYIIYVPIVYILKSDIQKGWTTLSLQSAGQFLIVTLMLTVLSEYVGRILERLRDRPFYYVRGEQSSSVLLVPEKRYNVETNSDNHDKSLVLNRRPSGD